MKLLVKDERELIPVLKIFRESLGISWHGTMYNSQSFLTLTKLYDPKESMKSAAEPFHPNLVWK